MVEVFNHPQASDNTAAAVDHNRESSSSLAVSSWKDMDKISASKVTSAETVKCLQFDDIYKKGCSPNHAEGDTTVKKVPQDGGMKEPIGKPNAAESDSTIYKKSIDGGMKEFGDKPNAATGDSSITNTPGDSGSKLQDNYSKKAEQMNSKESGKVIFDVDQDAWQKLFPKDK